MQEEINDQEEVEEVMVVRVQVVPPLLPSDFIQDGRAWDGVSRCDYMAWLAGCICFHMSEVAVFICTQLSRFEIFQVAGTEWSRSIEMKTWIRVYV